VTLSVAVITFNEEANIARTLESVRWADEIIVVDCGSTDRTREIAESVGAKVFIERWKGYAAQKNSAIEKATSDWTLSLDADEEVSLELAAEVKRICHPERSERPAVMNLNGYRIPRRNLFLGRAIRHGGFYPDRKLRLFRRGVGKFLERSVHEVVEVKGATGDLRHDLIHHSYPSLSEYIDHMNRYSSLGAEIVTNKSAGRFSVFNIVLRPLATFIYNYFFRLGFLDGKEGLLLHLYHAVYVSWKYAKAWEKARILPRLG
jgi:glycosyltransferase involved in cell wall biosynthesis